MMVGQMFATYPQPERNDGEWVAFWQPYYDALADLPEASVRQGIKAYNLLPDSEFLAKPGRLRQLATEAVTVEATAASRAYQATKAEPERPVSTPEGRAFVARELADLKHIMQEKAVEREAERPPPRPPIQAPLADGRFISAELAAKVGAA